MLDTLFRRMLDIYPFPQAPSVENEQLKFVSECSAEWRRCQSRLDSISVLFSENKREECLLLLQEAAPRLAALHNRIVAELMSLDTSDMQTRATTTAEDIQCISAPVKNNNGTTPSLEMLSVDIERLNILLSDTKCLLNQYKDNQPIFAEHFAYIKNRLFPFLATTAIICVFVAGLYSYKAFNAFKDLDIRFNWFMEDVHPRVVIRGVEPPEREGNTAQMFAWGLGPFTSVAFNCPGAYEFQLDFLVGACFNNQSIDVFVNGRPVKRMQSAGSDCQAGAIPETLLFTSRKGLNTIDIFYSDWNGNNTHAFSSEPRPLAVRFYAFSLKRTY